MKTFAIIALAAATTFTALPAFAQQSGEGRHQHRLEQTDREALVDARIAAIRAGLRLTAEQESLFTPVEQAIRDMAEQRMARWGEMAERRAEMRDEMRDMSREERRKQRAGRQTERDFMGRIQMQSDRAAENATQLGSLASAMNPLWDSLDESQQRLLPVLMRDTMGGRHGGHRMAGYQQRGEHRTMGRSGEGRGWQR